MLGGLIIIIVLLAIPPAVIMSGCALAALLSKLLTDEGEVSHPGSELIELNR